MNTTLRRARAAARLAVPIGLFAGVLAAQTAPTSTGTADVSSTEPQKLEKFEVTGSRIKRIDAETPSPVIRITHEALSNTGFTNVDDALRALPVNNGQAIVPEGSGNGFASGTSTVNLRGLGNNNTLVLIDGRRAVPSGSGAFNGFESVIDLRQIPTAWVDTIEVLKDGASAIYGSDAVSGVLNIKFRTGFTGLNVGLEFGNTMGTDSFEKSANLIAGGKTGRTSVTLMAHIYHRNAIKDVDYAFSRTADLRADRTGAGQIETDPTGEIATGVDLRSSSTFPARFFLPGTTTIRTFPGPTEDPQIANAVAVSRVTGAGLYDFQKDTFQLPEIDAKGLRTFVHHDFTENLYGFADLMIQRVEAQNGAAPSPFTTTDKGAGTNGRLVLPADNPYNPYGTRYFGAAGQAIELSTYRLVNAGPRLRDTTSDYPRMLAGIGGTLPADWSWEAAYMFAQGSYEDMAPGTAFDSAVQAALQGVVIDGQKLYANPFGPEDARITDYYSGTNPTKTTFSANLYDAQVSGNIFELPAGEVGMAAGAEFRKESIRDVRTIANETGNIVGGAEGFGYSGKRNVTSLYAELKVPVLRELELQLAGRYEDYSDFGTTTKPKVALAYRPTNWLMLRGSFSQSFKAPDLAFLYTKGSVSFTSQQVFDPRRPDQPSGQLKTIGRGNRFLKPEETDTYYLGAVVEVPRGPLKGLTFDIAYFKFSQTNLITRDSATFTLTNELRLPSGRVVRKDRTPAEIAAGYSVGIIDYIATDWFNADKQLLDGYDIGVNYTLNTRNLGRFSFGLDSTYIANSERDSVDSVGVVETLDQDGHDNIALWRGTGTISWKKGLWAGSIYVTGMGGFPPEQLGLPEPTMKDQWRVNPQVSYSGLWDSTITVGMRNALNDDPPRYIDASSGYYAGVSRADKAFWYVRVSRDF
jgi:outer membrane receptor for ferrienterochelin and colicin